jgi:hypothetical protein
MANFQEDSAIKFLRGLYDSLGINLTENSSVLNGIAIIVSYCSNNLMNEGYRNGKNGLFYEYHDQT